ncbi:hypothetical protein WMW72_10645 [Paenibacillus filicis]|uniref:Scaffolding protein n=1 Tax=Paenibacillus filicis TaxID=669464 RepID=A0ABU9DHL0_9BACL
MEDEVISASHSAEEVNNVTEAVESARAAFDLPKSEQASEIEQPEVDGGTVTDPAEHPQGKKITVKYNKQDVEIDEESVPELLQKGLALEKERERKAEAEKALQRAAKLAGYDRTEDYLANLDRIEQQAVQTKQDQLEQYKRQLLQEAEDSGLDPETLTRYLDNHPLFQQAQAALDREKQSQTVQKQQESEQQQLQKWEALFTKYPSLTDNLPEDGSAAAWLTPEMKVRIDRGYDPIDAYELAHRDTLTAQTKKQVEAAAIKAQRLNKRSEALGSEGGETEPQVPDELVSAFSMFGLNPANAKKYVKK